MENKLSGRPILPITITFFICSIGITMGRSLLLRWNTDFGVLLVANAILYGVTCISFILYSMALRNTNIQVFVRMVYGSLLVKMLVCLLATLLYAWLAGPVNRNAILGSFALYILYTYLEVRILLQLSKKSSKNA